MKPGGDSSYNPAPLPFPDSHIHIVYTSPLGYYCMDWLHQPSLLFFTTQVVALCREASICALEEDRSATQVRQAHLLEALGQMRPQITPSVLASYAAFQGGGR